MYANRLSTEAFVAVFAVAILTIGMLPNPPAHAQDIHIDFDLGIELPVPPLPPLPPVPPAPVLPPAVLEPPVPTPPPPVVQPQVQAEVGVEVLMRGPIHEAFASVVSFEPHPGIVVPRPAPPPIEEVPPGYRPRGEHVEWIPGYWAWDDERRDFLWVSGVWRASPPARQFVPGYWMEVRGGFQWVSGYWATVDTSVQQVSEIRYLPKPPPPRDLEPVGPAPSARHFWAPGCWVWQETRYSWRPGFWIEDRPAYMYCPAHYIWAPGGYIFVEGYWDYDLQARGVLFAPVYYEQPVYQQTTYSYSPRAVVDPDTLTDHLFVRPQYDHYYFGDFHAARYSTAGIQPWFSFHAGARFYDPIYAHYRAVHLREDRDWEQRVRSRYAQLRDNPGARPQYPFDARAGMVAATDAPMGGSIVRPLDDLAVHSDATIRYEPIEDDAIQAFGYRGRQMHRFRDQRRDIDRRAAARRGAGTSAHIGLLTIPVPPLSPDGADARVRLAPAFPMPPSPFDVPRTSPSRGSHRRDRGDMDNDKDWEKERERRAKALEKERERQQKQLEEQQKQWQRERQGRQKRLEELRKQSKRGYESRQKTLEQEREKRKKEREKKKDKKN